MGARQSCDVRHFYPRSPCGERRQQPAGTTSTTYFYPRSPCGERHKTNTGSNKSSEFLSTLSLRRATIIRRYGEPDSGNFYPRSPCGERQTRQNWHKPHRQFLSTLSLRRATAKVHKTVGHFCAYGTNFMGIASSC